METPKKPVKKNAATKSAASKKPAEKPADPKAKKRFVDDDEDDEFDVPMDDLGRFDSFDGYEEDDDFLIDTDINIQSIRANSLDAFYFHNITFTA